MSEALSKLTSSSFEDLSNYEELPFVSPLLRPLSIDSVDASSDAQLKILLQQVESVDSKQLGSLVRTIYDRKENRKFMERLDARIKNHDRDIERMCNFHYEGFIESIRELLQVRSQAQKLKNEITQADVDLQESAHDLLQRGKELTGYRLMQSNIAAAVESLSICLPVLQMYTTLQKQMKDKKYYPALKTLDQLEHSHLPLVASYQFFQQMRDRIPILRQKIKEDSFSDLKFFLESVRKNSPAIGARAMTQVIEQNKWDSSLIPVTPEMEISKNENILDICPQDIVQFSPVYRCLHIHTVLGAKESFETNYQNQRLVQAELAQEPPNLMRETLERYRDYLCGIVGFFVVEEHLLNTADGLVSRAYLNEAWDKAVSKINSAIRKEAAYCTDDAFMIKIIHIVVLFRVTIQGYGYSVQKLNYLVPELQSQYLEILMQKWNGKFKDIFQQDQFTPIVVQTEEEYNAVLEMFPYKDEILEKASFPKRFPFSSLVPAVYDQIIKYIRACQNFLIDLRLNTNEANDTLKKSINTLLMNTLSNCLSDLIKDSRIWVPQTIQLLSNINFLEQSCIHIEDYIDSVAGKLPGGSNTTIQGQMVFKRARTDAEAKIYLQLQTKIIGSLSLEAYDWLLPEMPVVDDKIQGQPSGFIIDLIGFLRNILFSSPSPPVKIVQTACMRACMHISQQLMKFLTEDKSVKQISRGALQQLSLDVEYCEKFATEPVNGLDEGTLLMYFADLRQMINLFVHWDWSIYFYESCATTKKYLRVTPAAAFSLFEKYRDAEKKNLIYVLKKEERDKQKLMETVYKELKARLKQEKKASAK